MNTDDTICMIHQAKMTQGLHIRNLDVMEKNTFNSSMRNQ